jgi:hypothetical protein
MGLLHGLMPARVQGGVTVGQMAATITMKGYSTVNGLEIHVDKTGSSAVFRR